MRALHMAGWRRHAWLAVSMSTFATAALAQISPMSVSGSITAGAQTRILDQVGITKLFVNDGSHALGVQSLSSLDLFLQPGGRQLDVSISAAVDHVQGGSLVPSAGGLVNLGFDLSQDVQAFFSYAATNSISNVGSAASFTLSQIGADSLVQLDWPLSGQTVALKAGHYRLSSQWLSSVDPGWGPGHATVGNITTTDKLTVRVTAVPEAGSLAMLVAGLACVSLAVRRQHQQRV
jgi:hypothetical protein